MKNLMKPSKKRVDFFSIELRVEAAKDIHRFFLFFIF